MKQNVKAKLEEKHFGKLPPRYSFALNPYVDARFSKCPKCNKATYSRKFPLLIHVNGFGPFVLGKSCRYCSKCEFIIAHQNELEAQIALTLTERAPLAIGSNYFVYGTVEKKTWQQGLAGKTTMIDMQRHTAAFKHYLTLKLEHAGWVPANRK